MKRYEITVIGAGIVGVCCALYLQREGHRVTLLDRDEPGMGCSFGNAGILEGNAVVPVATPGLLRQLPGLILDPLGPLAIKWAQVPRLLPWLLRFLRESGAVRARANARALAPLVLNAFEPYRPLIEEADAGGLIHDTGWLWTFESRRTLDAMHWDQGVRRELGIEMEEVRGQRLSELAPALSRDIELGLYFPTSRACSDPYELVRRLVDAFRRGGGTVRRCLVDRIRPGKPIVLDSEGETLGCERLVVAAGAWSGRLCRGLGEPVPLNTERGYHCMLPEPAVRLPVPLMFAEHKFVAHGMDQGLRLAGTIELGGLDRPPDWRRADALLHHARRLLPGLDDSGYTRWMGFRPTLPDSLPVIGPSVRHAGVYYAFGHQHLGLTLGALTGEIIAAQVSGKEPPVDARPYAIARYRGAG